VKAGEIDLKAIDGTAALALLLTEPILIRRPLVEANDDRCAGFDREPVTSLLGADKDVNEGCSRAEASPRCPDPNPPSLP
jgi:hypothetical protein